MQAQPVPTYTTAQVHHRLGIPKPTIRNWSAEYAAFLSDRAQPDHGRARLFTHSDLIILNTVRHLTRSEGLSSNDLVRAQLAGGLRIEDLPDLPTAEERAALRSVSLIPADRLQRALDQAAALQAELARLRTLAAELTAERDQALIALDGLARQLSTARARHGLLRGILYAVSMTSLSLLFVTLAALATLILTLAGYQP